MSVASTHQESSTVYSHSWRRKAFVVLCGMALLLVAMLAFGSGKLHLFVGFLVAAALVCAPFFSPELSIVVLGFAGRFAFPPLLSGFLDVAFWSAVGLYVFTVVLRLGRSGTTVRIHLGHPIFITFTVLALFAVASYPPMLGHDYALEKMLRVLIYTMSFLTFTQVVLRDEASIFRFLRLFVAFVAVLASVSLLVTLVQTGFAGIQRISPPGGGTITLARMTGFAAIACLGLFLASNRKDWLIGTLLFTLMTFMTGSRAPTLFLGLAYSVVIFPLIMNRVSRAKGWMLFVAGGAGIAFMVAVFVFAVNRALPFALRYLVLMQAGGGESVSVRVSFIEDALEFSRKSPAAGFGTGSWPVITGSPSEVAYPHNYFLEIVVEQGTFALVTALLALLITVIVGFRIVLRGKSVTTVAAATVGLSSFVYAALIAQTSGDLYDNRYLWFFAGFLIACDTLHRATGLEVYSPHSGGLRDLRLDQR